MNLIPTGSKLTSATQQALEMINRFEEGVMILTANAEAILINQSLQALYPKLTNRSQIFQALTLYTQKHQAQRFDLQAWLKSLP